MRRRTSLLAWAFVVTTALLAGNAQATAPAAGSGYTTVDLGLYQGKATWAHGLNDNGRIVGHAGGAGNERPMQWTAGKGWIPMSPLPGDDRGVAYSISNHREIGGWSGGTAKTVAVVWDADRMFQAPLLPGTDDAEAFSINDLREIAGTGTAGDGTVKGFFWCKKSGLIPVGKLPGMTQSAALGINNHRVVVGWSGTESSSRAFLWSKHTREIVDLGTLPGWNWSMAFAINDAGDVVGAATNGARTVMRAFLLSGGTFTDLGTLGGTSSAALGINEFGQVVGWSELPSGQKHAFVWTAGAGMVDLGGVMGGGSSVAAAINEDGVIVGYGDDSGGQSHGLMFVPK